MRFAYALGLAASLMATLVVGCDERSREPRPTEKPPTPVVSASITWFQDGPLTLAPGESASLMVETTPPNEYPIQFRLVGDSLDASLDTAKTITGADGRATLELRAPKQATTFAVRATIEGGPSRDLVVSVSGQGFVTLEVIPSYLGNRAIESWTALAVTGTTCAALAPKAPADPDGALSATAAVGATLLVSEVPVGPALAVVVRSEKHVWGCADAAGLGPGSIGKVEVPVTNRPLDTTDSSVDVTLEIVPEKLGWLATLDATRAAMLASFTVNGTEAETLRAAMFAAAANAKELDESAWLAALAARLGDPGARPTAALAALATTLPDEAPTLRGRTSGLDASHAVFTLATFGTLDVSSAGGPTEHLISLTVDPNDQVHLGGALFLMPSRYLGARLEAAVAVDPGTPTLPAWLAKKLGCTTLEVPVTEACNSSCVRSACEQGIANLWEHALDTSVTLGLHAEVALTVTGAATMDDEMRLSGFDGSWLGVMKSGDVVTKMSGSAVGVPANDAPAN